MRFFLKIFLWATLMLRISSTSPSVASITPLLFKIIVWRLFQYDSSSSDDCYHDVSPREVDRLSLQTPLSFQALSWWFWRLPKLSSSWCKYFHWPSISELQVPALCTYLQLWSHPRLAMQEQSHSFATKIIIIHNIQMISYEEFHYPTLKIHSHAIRCHHENLWFLTEKLGKTQVSNFFVGIIWRSYQFETFELSKVSVMSKQVDEDELGDVSCSGFCVFFLQKSDTQTIKLFITKNILTRNEFRMAAFSLPTKARSSAAVLQPRTPLMSSFSLIELIFAYRQKMVLLFFLYEFNFRF